MPKKKKETIEVDETEEMRSELAGLGMEEVFDEEPTIKPIVTKNEGEEIGMKVSRIEDEEVELRKQALLEKLAIKVPAKLQKQIGNRGKMFNYIDGQTAIRLANEIFGNLNWNSQMAGDIKYIPLIDDKGRQRGIYYVPVVVSIKIDETYSQHMDVGTCVIASDSPESHDTAIKGCVTDGIKRALKNFGEGLGLSLYPDMEDAPLNQTVATFQTAGVQAEVRPTPVKTYQNNNAQYQAAAQGLPQTQEEGHPCADCGDEITTWASYTGTIDQLIAFRTRQVGRPVCGKCISRIRKEKVA